MKCTRIQVLQAVLLAYKQHKSTGGNVYVLGIRIFSTKRISYLPCTLIACSIMWRHLLDSQFWVPEETRDGGTEASKNQSFISSKPSSHLQYVYQTTERFKSSPILESDVRGDRAQERVFLGLRALADKNQDSGETMMVISQLQFGKYLNKPAYAPAAASLPRPVTLGHHFRRGDFDVLIIHKQHGLIAGEIKSVGSNFELLKKTEQEKDAILLQKVKETIHALNKAETILKHITSNLSEINVTKIPMMPYITKEHLLRVVNIDPFTAQELRDCLSAKDNQTAVELCLTSDCLPESSEPWNFQDSILEKLQVWWRRQFNRNQSPMSLDESHYETLLARFCGPATTVDVYCVIRPRLEVRTEGDMVSETGDVLSRIVLFPEQVDILNQCLGNVFLVGPPGTGKTIVLILQGINWLQRGRSVHVISTWKNSLAASMLIKHQIEKTIHTSHPDLTAQLHLNFLDLDNYDTGIKSDVLENIYKTDVSKKVGIIADEAIYMKTRNIFQTFCDDLILRNASINIWAARVKNKDEYCGFIQFTMNRPLRSPPVVIREVQACCHAETQSQKKEQDTTQSEAEQSTVTDKDPCTYTKLSLAVSDGPPIKRIRHENGQDGHTSDRPESCETCGKEVARVVLEFRVGSSGTPLKYSDFLVLCDKFTNGKEDSIDETKSPYIRLVEGMLSKGVPVRIVDRTDDQKAISDTALAQTDAVTVTNINTVKGLERKVVIVTDKWTGLDKYSQANSIARCTSQLVFINSKPDDVILAREIESSSGTHFY